MTWIQERCTGNFITQEYGSTFNSHRDSANTRSCGMIATDSSQGILHVWPTHVHKQVMVQGPDLTADRGSSSEVALFICRYVIYVLYLHLNIYTYAYMHRYMCLCVCVLHAVSRGQDTDGCRREIWPLSAFTPKLTHQICFGV